MNRIPILLISCLLLIACTPSWTLITSNNANLKVGSLSFQAPKGWVIYGEHLNKYPARVRGEIINYTAERLMMTKNGHPLDLIDVTRLKLDKSFPSIEQTADNVLLPEELAEKYLAETQITMGNDNLIIVKNEPVTIAQRKGFRLQYRLNNNKGLQNDKLTYGFIANDGFYTITYRAPSLYYFKAGLSDFKNLVNSLLLRS